MPKTALILYISNISGHYSASQAVKYALREENGSIKIVTLNILGYIYPLMEKVIVFFYDLTIKRFPIVWGSVYDNPKFISRTDFIKKWIFKSNRRKLRKLFQEYQPDVVICTQALPAGLAADYLQAESLDTPLIGVLTDFLPHRYWVHPRLNYYIAANNVSKQRFLEMRIPEDKIKTLGIPIHPNFLLPFDSKALLSDLSFEPNILTILVMGGAQGLGPIKRILKDLSEIKGSIQIIVVCGTNKKLFRWSRKLKEDYPHPMMVFGYVKDIEKLMDVSDVIISKPGGLTVSEALCKELVFLAVGPIPGQEENNCQVLSSSGALLKAKNTQELKDMIKLLIDDPRRLYSMKEAAKDTCRPDAARQLAKFVLQL